MNGTEKQNETSMEMPAEDSRVTMGNQTEKKHRFHLKMPQKGRKHSVKKRIAYTFIATMAATLLIIGLINYFFLGSFYIRDKEHILAESFQKLNATGGDSDDIPDTFEQFCATNNLKVIMQSRDMARIYGTTTRSYTALCGDLTNYQTVNKSEITTERTLKENLDQAKKDLEEAKKNLEELQKQNAAKDAEIAKAKAEVEAAKKDLQAAKTAAKKAAVKSVKRKKSVRTTNKKIVKVDKKGKITGKKAGKAIVTVKKVAGAEGYQVQYSLKKSMKSAKNVKIKKNSITIKRLKKGKTYYVRVRAFSKDSNGKQICTAWSTTKKVTIKK